MAMCLYTLRLTTALNGIMVIILVNSKYPLKLRNHCFQERDWYSFNRNHIGFSLANQTPIPEDTISRKALCKTTMWKWGLTYTISICVGFCGYILCSLAQLCYTPSRFPIDLLLWAIVW